MSPTIHVPVLPAEVLGGLQVTPGQTVVDATLGGGGHTRLLAEAVGSAGRVVALDRDPDALSRAESALAGLPILLVHSDFRHLKDVLAELEMPPVDAIVLDLGLSSDQLADRQRGFSFQSDAPLDMRFDPDRGVPAWHLLNELPESELADLIYRYGEERFSRRIARQIVQRRRTSPVRTTQELAALVRRCVPRARGHRIDSATRTFQALRIAVNDELGALESVMRDIPDCLRGGGRVAVISFHSLEDRLVKHAIRDDSRYVILTKKPIRPNETEVMQNPNSRSARLRIAERLAS